MFVSGNRYYLIIAILEFLSSYFIVNKPITRRRLRKKRKLSFGFLIAFCLFIGTFLIISKVRSTWIDTNQYSSPLMNRLVSRFGGSVYKIYTYAASPIPVLDAFLRDPYYSYGIFTFYPFFNLFRKFGIVSGGPFLGKSYYVPIDANTGTYILSLIADFSWFSIFVVSFFGYLCGKIFKKACSGSLFYVSLNAILFSVLSLCFFSWYFSDSGLWICALVLIVSECFDKLFKTKTRYSHRL